MVNTAKYISTGSSAGLAVCDTDGDGLVDLVEGHQLNFENASRTISYFHGVATAGFGTEVAYSTNSRPQVVATLDVNHDCRADVAVGTDEGLDVLFGASSGLTGRVPLSSPMAVQGVTSLRMGHLNSDAFDDLVSAGSSAGQAFVAAWLGSGSGTLQFASSTNLSHRLTDLDVGDINQDGMDDIAAVSAEGKTFSVFLSRNGAIAMQPTDLILVDTPRHIALADLDNDGNLDVIITTSTLSGSGLLVYQGNGTGFFGAPAMLPSAFSSALAVADIDNDGVQDIVVGGQIVFGDDLSGHSARMFRAGGTVAVRIVDANRDGWPDIAVSGNSVEIYLNAPQ